MKFLIIDDDINVREMLTRYLSSYEVEILQAENGKEGLKLFKKHLPAVTILDLRMSVMTGIEFLKKLDPQLFTDHFIIVMTGHGGDEDIETCYSLGVQSFLSKPVNFFLLKGSIDRAIRLHQAFSETEQLNQRLSLRQQDIPNALWESDSDLCFTYVEETIETLIGLSAEQMVGLPITDFIAPSDIDEFELKFRGEDKKLKAQIKGLTLSFKKSDKKTVALQIFANSNVDHHKTTLGMVGIFRDMNAFSSLISSDESENDVLNVCLDNKGQIVSAGKNVWFFLGKSEEKQNKKIDFLQFMADPSLIYLITFAFDQKEDVPFPIEVNLVDGEKKEHHFTVNFVYQANNKMLEGTLIPINANTNLTLARQKMDYKDQTIKKQEETLRDSIIVDEDIQKSILTDGINLASEILQLIKSLEVYAYHPEGTFDLDEYELFILNRNVQIYIENLRLLGNKIHGLKGTCGFLIQEAKHLCHKIEDLTLPLTELKLVLTQDQSLLLKQFIFKIIDLLEEFEKNPKASFSIDDWFERIDALIARSVHFIGNKKEQFAELVKARAIDSGDIRTRKKDDYLSVSLRGYEYLAEKAKDLFYSAIKLLPQEAVTEPSEHFNEFLTAHQRIKKVPVDLSRYERLVPKIAKDYQKSAEFHFKDHRVKADREFWNSIHEILNHVLKNAVIHGIESEAERTKAGKDKEGKVRVEINEDAVHIYLSVEDDGRGINLEKIIAKALEEKVTHQEEVNQLSKEELLNLLFIQGVSTAEELDDNAGRGVGMNAVQEAMKLFDGSCGIETEDGKGSKWKFTFAKKNVSLQCVVMKIGEIAIAIPESFVETFVEYREDKRVTLKGSPAYNHDNHFLPLVDTKGLLECDATSNGEQHRNVIVLKYQNEKKGMVINEILNSVILPINPVPKPYRNIKVYQGVALYNNTPLQVVNVEMLML